MSGGNPRSVISQTNAIPTSSSRSSNGSYRPSTAQSKPVDRRNVKSRGGTAMSGNPNQKSDGKIIGQYKLGKTLGEGTFGKVRQAIHIPTGEKVF